MTAFDRFDPFEQRITAAIDEIAAPRRPDYLDDILRQTARTSQRPRWTFPERWLPVDTSLSRSPARRTPLRPLVLIAIVALLALAATAILVAGSRPSVPLPVGPAGNGSLVYASNGDIYVRPTIDGAGTPIVTGSAVQVAPYLSPDGRTLVYAQAGDGGDYFWAVGVDGSNPRQILPDPIGDGWSQWSWATDSSHLLVSGVFPGGARRLYDVQADGTGARELTFDGLVPWEGYWSPTDPNTFLLRAQTQTGLRSQGLYLVDADGGNLRPLKLLGQSSFGEQHTLSGAAWSPDGKDVAYNAIVVDPGSLVTHFRVHLVDPDGTGDRAVPGPEDPLVQEAWPAYSPDGKWIVVHRWTWKDEPSANGGEGWLAVMPADGSEPARDIGPRISGGQDTGLSKIWSPDGRRVLMQAANTQQVFSIDPVTGEYEALSWTTELPDWQRVIP